jgi:hypothetical protein
MPTSSRKRVSLDWERFNWVVSQDVIEHLFLPRLLVQCAFGGLKKTKINWLSGRVSWCFGFSQLC